MSEQNGKSIDLGEDLGRAEITIGEQTITVDLWKAYLQIGDAFDREISRQEYHGRLASIVKQMGFDGLSEWAVDRICEAVCKRVESLKKNATSQDSPSPASPSSTTPESSP